MKKQIIIGSIVVGLSCLNSVVYAEGLQEDFLKDMSEGLTQRWTYDSNEDIMTRSEFVEYRTALVNEEYSRLEKYKNEEFENEKFNTLAHTYIEALEMQLHALDYYIDYSSIYDIEWAAGYDVRAVIVPAFYDTYGLDVDSSEVDTFRSGTSYSIDVTSSSMPKEIVKSEIEVYNNEGIRIWVTGFVTTSYDQEITFKVENLNHHDISISTEDGQMIVNGNMMYSSFWADVKSGKTSNATMYFYADDLTSHGVENISEVSFKFFISDGSTYSNLFTSDTVYLSIDANKQITTRTVYSDRATIQKVQELLTAVGYNCGSTDGVAGKLTNSAILNFERDHNLPENTDITPELLVMLQNAIG